MKKKLFLSSVIALSLSCSVVRANACASSISAKIANGFPVDTGITVKIEDLPQPIKTALAGDSYKGWTISAASYVKNSTDDYYRVFLKNGDNTKTVKMDKNGNLI